ncbi:MAG: response regulator [Thermodesulfobacteriota bacterium]|nr:response regulator [Thermodesulfobacteriota bacterium]
MKIKYFLKLSVCTACLTIALFFSWMAASIALANDDQVKIGILAKRGCERCVKKWTPTAEYLTSKIPDKTFVIIPLDYDKIYSFVERGEVDFILANSSFYVELEQLYGTNRIATLKNRVLRKVCTMYEGVIFCKSDRHDIRNLKDLKGKTFMAVSETSFGGWRMAWRELKERGIDPYRDFKELRFGEIQDAVVYAVRDGKVDAGTVRADTFARMHTEGKIDMQDFYVLQEHGEKIEECPSFPRSTRSYPTWPFAELKHTPDELAEQVAIALIEMPSDSPAAIAATSTGWTIPKNYESVHECLIYLKVGPYEHLGEITLSDLIRNYWYLILLALLSFLIMSVFTFTIQKLNKKLKASHVKLEDARAYTRGLIESSLDALLTFDESGVITDVNEEMIKLTGYTREELTGSRFCEYFTDQEKACLTVKKAFEEGKVTNFELVMKSKTGDETEVSYNAIVYTYEKGKVRGVFAAARNISESKRVQKELKKAKEAAETATRTKSEFLANMSHEIRTPMNGIIAATDLVLSEELSPRVKNYMKIIHSSAYSLLAIINDILDFSKIEADKLKLKKRSFWLVDVLSSVMDMFLYKAAEKRIEIVVDIDIETPEALIGDSLRLQQILKNLIDNAIKFTDRGGIILVGVKILKESLDQTILKFFVKDTGVGIAPEDIPKLFKPFSQADTSTTRRYEGTGLGLCICRQLVNMLDGNIRVESEVGKGSVFTFTASFGRQITERQRKIIAPPDIQGLNVLVIDDCAVCRDIMQKMLESFNFRVESVSSGEESLNILKENQTRKEPFELIMIDWLMPGLDGIETSRRIRMELKLTIPIILMTAFGKEDEKLDAERVGINCFLTKPIYQSELFNAVMDAFGKEARVTTRPEIPIITKASIYKKRLKGIRILVAEDNPTNQEIALAILEGAGIVAQIADNGKKAVEAVQKGRFDAVLMDIQMPEMDGYEATRVIRENPEFKSIPIIAMTAHAMEGDEEKCLGAGMDGYISKPIIQDKLFHAIWKSLKHKERLPHAEEPEDIPEKPAIETGELPATLPGINIQDTLKRLNIGADVFKRILIGFLNNNKDTANNIKDLFEKKDWESLMHLAHSLKGSAGNIGADDLQEAAFQLEKASREGAANPPEKNLVDNVATPMSQVLESLQTLADTEKGPVCVQRTGRELLDVKAGVVDPAKVIPLLKQLADALDLADPMEITKYMDAVREYLNRSILQNLEKQINEYNYDKALETIKEISEKVRR